MKRLMMLAGLIGAAWMMAAAPASAACAPEGKASYLCGVKNAEDLVLVPGTSWIIASGSRDGSCAFSAAM